MSAAVLHGLPVGGVPLTRVYTTRPRRSGGLRTGRLHVHTAPLDPEDVVDVAGTAVTSVERTLLDLGRTVGFEQAVVLIDAALHRHVTDRDALLAAPERLVRWPGASPARRVVAFADPGRRRGGGVAQPGGDGPVGRARDHRTRVVAAAPVP